MTPTAIFITGTHDANANHPDLGPNFLMCSREMSTHVSVYLADEEQHEPVRHIFKDLRDMGAAAYADALCLACDLSEEHNVPIRDVYQRKPKGTIDLSQVTPEAAYQSIQVAATNTENGITELVEECSSEKTHYSVFLRRGDGTCEHVEDYPSEIDLYQQALARVLAFNRAAHLSMEHGVPIEQIR